MPKNEAKIKFTAETKEANAAIKAYNGEMSELRAELKLNETQMKATGNSVDSLKKKHSILENQLKASEGKTEALNQKVQKAVEIFGENSQEASKLRTQLVNAQTAEERIRQAISKCNTELQQQADAAKEAESATAKLTDKIDKQQTELNQLKSDYVDAVLQYGKTSDEAKDLAKQIGKLSSELADNQSSLGKAEAAADKLDKSFDNAGDAARDSAEGFTIAKGAIANLAADAIAAAIGKVTEFISYLKELPEATRELRQDMATLETSFSTAGLTTEQATNTWKELYKVFGEDDRAVEASNLIAKMSDDQQDLNDWVLITQGVWGSYQDSLPVEGLAEASMESAKTGEVTGVLADALNWSSEAASMFAKYMGEDVTTAEDAFNVALSECTTEEERQALITETLTKLYGDAAKEYEKASGAQLDAKEATAENTLVQNELADAIEPVTTAWQELKTDALEALLPVVESVTGTMTDMLDWMKEHPVAMKAISAAVGVLAVGLGGLAIAAGIYTAAQWAMNSALLANPITWIVIGVIAAIAAVIAAIVVVVEYWDEIVEACKNAWQAVCDTLSGWGEWINTNVIQPIVNFFKGLWDSIVSVFRSIIDWVKNNWKSIVLFLVNPLAGVFNYLYENFEGFRNFIDKVVSNIKQFFVNLWDGIKEVWNGICNAISVAIQLIGSIISAAFQIITLPFRFIWENCKDIVFSAWEWVKNAVSTAINAVKNVITTVMNAIKNTFSTVWNAVKNVTSTVFNAVKSVVSTIWNSIKSKVTTVVNAVKNTVSTVWNAIKTATSTAFNAVKSVVSTVWNAIKNAVSKAVNAVKTTVSNVWNAIKNATSTAFNAVKNTAANVWNSIKSAISNVVNGVKSTVSNVWNGIKSTTSNVFNSLKSTVSNVWNNIKNAILKPIEAAKTKIKGIVDSIKGFFSGMKLELPKIKMPHFKIEGKLSLSPPSVPKLKIDWYKDGGIMMNPTIFGVNGNNLMAGGEAGPEAILPIDKLEGYISGAIEKAQNVVNLQSLADAIDDLAKRPVKFYIGDREIALATASASDSVNGLRSTLTSRGLAVE